MLRAKPNWQRCDAVAFEERRTAAKPGSSAPRQNSDSKPHLSLSLLGTRNVVEWFRDRVVFAHTYLGGATLYGEQKRAAAEIVRAAGGTAVRIANVYGPGSRRARATLTWHAAKRTF